MSTTNGTRAIAAATEAKKLFLGALVNASAVAETLVHEKLDAILLCAGTDGAIALEDMLGAGAVIHELLLRAPLQLDSDSAQIAQRMFDACRSSLLDDLGNAAGGRNILAAGLPQDIDFAARMNVFHVVGEVAPRELIVRGQQKM
jgi:2-phosphosulfolactate phosphatase